MVGTNDLQDAKGDVGKLPEVVEPYKEHCLSVFIIV